MSETKIAVPFLASSADPEVPAKAQRRKFGAEDKKRILDEVDRAAGHGGMGAVLRWEGIYYSTLHGWRKMTVALAGSKRHSRELVGLGTGSRPVSGQADECPSRAGELLTTGLRGRGAISLRQRCSESRLAAFRR